MPSPAFNLGPVVAFPLRTRQCPTASFISIYMKENAEAQQRMMQMGEPAFLTPGEIEQTNAMLLSELPRNRTWAYRVARAGYAGL